MEHLRIGTSGWNYPAGPASWNGLFYPLRPDTAGRRTFDELAYYAQFFDTVEVNSSFYRQPTAAMTRRWVERTPPEFEFSVKLFQRLTHAHPIGRDTASPVSAESTEAAAAVTGRAHSGAGSPGARDSPAPRLDSPSSPAPHGRVPHSPAGPGPDASPALPPGSETDVDVFRAGIDPLAEGGKLGAVLVQFPPAFRMTPQTIDYLRWLLARLHNYQVAVELRHRTWSDRGLDTQAILAETGAAWTQIDEPKFRFSIRQDFRANVPGCYYLRLHGRNAASWWRPEHPEDRYNYLYSESELAPVAEAAEAAQAGVRKAYAYFNNHYSAKAVVNAAMLKTLLRQPVTGEFEPALAERYPELRGVGRVRKQPSGAPTTLGPLGASPSSRPRGGRPTSESPRLPWDTDR